MQRPVCLITGATEGVGKATATALARKGFQVVIAARNAAKAEAVRTEINATVGRRAIDVVIGDLASLTQVRQIAETFKTRYETLDVLINNAGVLIPDRQVTEDGLEATFQINYLSPFLLTQLLLPQLRESEQGRIINLTSSIYTLGKLDPGAIEGKTPYSPMASYAASKLFMLLFTIELAARLKGTPLTANAVHPGIVRTQMMTTAKGVFRLLSILATPVAISPEKGARTSVYLASSPDVATVSGCYFMNGKPHPVKTRLNTDETRERLWRLSVESLQARGLCSAQSVKERPEETFTPLATAS